MDWSSIDKDSPEKYALYLCSRDWGVLKKAVFERANGICERCKKEKIRSVHHLTYARKYKENLEDLLGVCTPCHEYFHPRPSHESGTVFVGEFLKGPIPLGWLSEAAKLSKSSLAVSLALWFHSGRRKSYTVVLTTKICERFSINRKAKYRALKDLEKVGLISVQRNLRKNPTVTILLDYNKEVVDYVI